MWFQIKMSLEVLLVYYVSNIYFNFILYFISFINTFGDYFIISLRDSSLKAVCWHAINASKKTLQTLSTIEATRFLYGICIWVKGGQIPTPDGQCMMVL